MFKKLKEKGVLSQASLVINLDDRDTIIFIPDVRLRNKAFKINEAVSEKLAKEINSKKAMKFTNFPNFNIPRFNMAISIHNYIDFESNGNIFIKLWLFFTILIKFFFYALGVMSSKENIEKFLHLEKRKIRDEYLFNQFTKIGGIMGEIDKKLESTNPESVGCYFTDTVLKYHFYKRYNIFNITLLDYDPNSKPKFYIFNSIYFIYDMKNKKLYHVSEREIDDYMFLDYSKMLSNEGAIPPSLDSPKFEQSYEKHEISLLDAKDLYEYIGGMEE